MRSHTYRAEVHREDRWWIIRVPELDDANGTCIGQAKRYDDIDREARHLVTLVADVAPSKVDLDLHIEVAGVDVGAVATTLARNRAAAAAAQREVVESTAVTARRLRAAGLDLRDIGSVVGVSVQRVSQLVNG